MKTLVVFYSRTGHTRKIGQILEETLQCDAEEISDTKNRMGLFGWLRSGRDAMRRKLTTIQPPRYNPRDYDLIIMGTPVWGGMPTPAIRTYITQNFNNLKKVALFCTHGGSDVDKVFTELEKICDQKAVALLEVRTEQVNKNLFIAKIKQFTGNINK
jgi:flavodoxin